MARTAPAPDIPPIPGMCPSVAVLAGGGDGGGGSGKGAGSGDGDENAGAGGGGDAAAGDGKGAPDPAKYPDCGTVSHPVDAVTGRVFTHAIEILALPGPLPLVWERVYSSTMAGRDTGLGYGWGHTLGWEVEIKRRKITVWSDQGTGVDFPMVAVGEDLVGKWGWYLRREAWGFIVDTGDDVKRVFSFADEAKKRVRLTAVEDRNRNRIALTYDDADGRLLEVTDSAGRQIRVVRSRTGHIGSLEVKNAFSQGRWVPLASFAHDDKGDLIGATDADGSAWRYTYHEDHLLATDTDRSGLTWHFVYDDKRRGIEAWGSYPGQKDASLAFDLPRYLHDNETRCKGIHHCKINYHDGAGFNEVIDSTQARNFFGNPHGTLDKSVVGGGVTTAVYRDDGHLIGRTNPMEGTEHFTRDARGRVVQYMDEIGRVTSIARDGNGLPVEITNPQGGVHRMERDARGNMTLYMDPTGAVTSFRHDERGLCTEQVSPTGQRTTYEYDAHGNLFKVTLPGGGVWRYTYDFLGQRVSTIDPLGAETRYGWSARGDLVAERDAAGGVTQYAYDGEHRLTQIVDPKGGSTTFGWGGFHKLCFRRDANGHEVRFGYNVEGELIVVRNEKGEEHQLRYNPSGRLIEEVTFDGRTLTYHHDRMGRVAWFRDGNRSKTTLTYDLASQLLERELPGGSVETFEYDLLGDLSRAGWPGGEVRFERDAVGRVVREVQVVGGEEHVVELALDADGEQVGRKTSLGHTEAIERGILGARRRTVLDGEHVVEHEVDAMGREIAQRLPAGGRIESAFDLMDRLERRRVLGPPVARSENPGEPAWVGPRADNATVDMSYRYDPGGELLASWDKQRGQTAYTYDPIGQLLSRVPEKVRAEVFRYDPAGNLHEGGSDAERREYGKGNRLIWKGDTEYHHDFDGRLSEKWIHDPATGQKHIWKYRWNPAGLLQSVTTPGGELIEFMYDPFARRVEKRVGKAVLDSQRPVTRSVTRFVWGGDVLVHEIKRTAAGAGDPVVEVKTYCFEDDGFAPVAHRDAAGWFHYVNDPIGTPVRLVGADGSVACELRRDAWGRTEATEGSKTGTAIRFPGQYEDEETRLCYNRFRYYEPTLGLFISPDPLGLDADLNFFAYCPNPLLWDDPLGLAGTQKRRRRKRERIEAATARGGDRGCRGAVSEKEAARMGREHVGEGHTRVIGRNGNEILTSADGRRRYRGPDNKRPAFDERGQPYSRTGRQANFETFDRGGARTANVHIDVKD